MPIADPDEYFFSEDDPEWTAYVASVWRGKDAWWMNVEDVLIGHGSFGFDYLMHGDLRP